MSGTSDETAVTEIKDTPGSRLLRAREALGLSQKAVADELHLPRNYIVWIEEEAYEKLPSMVFCRGYIRSFAKIVKEDGEALIGLLGEKYSTANNHKAALKTVSKIEAQVKVGDPVMKWPTLVFIIALGGVVFWWWQTQYGLNDNAVSAQAPISVEIANGNELLLPSLSDSEDTVDNILSIVQEDTDVLAQEAELVDTPMTLVAQNMEPISPGESINLPLNLQQQSIVEEAGTEQLALVVANLEPDLAEQAPSAVSTSVLPGVLTMIFQAECWVTIKDNTGKTVFNGLKVAGAELQVSGEEPLQVSIGRVDAIAKLSYAGKNIDLRTISRNNIANFNLPL